MKDKMTIEDVCTFIGGSQPPKSHFIYDEKEGYIRLIQTRDYKTDRFLTYIPKEEAKKVCDENDVMIGRYGPPVFQILRGLKGAYNVALMKAVPKDNILNDYLYYLLKQDCIFKYVDALSSRTGGQTGVDLDSLYKYPVLLPDKIYQEKVVNLLGGIDNKIKNNNELRNLIESMLNEIYIYWFVNFNFPNSDGKPYKLSGGKMKWNEELQREIPYDWEYKPISEICNIGNSSINPFNFPDKIYKYFTIPYFDSKGTYTLESGSNIKSNKFALNKGDIIISKLNPWFNRIVLVDLEESICSTEFVPIKPRDNMVRNYLYTIFISKNFIDYCSFNATGTSNSHKRVDPEIMLNYKVCYSDKIINLFGNFANEFISQIVSGIEENQVLSNTRDFLLPLLMNGQIKF